ncbi:uncharacterized protein LOC126266736 [Schistocerca gregaria]|uniref:uncharacterized protein LOC126266736 n=1 Tax=Schistocerca gregaria TaxID=7010 RepID=UPI00211E7F1C|nr:uncharacterized protein LOC126266736 [Schistocerca gregaria]
MSCGEASTAGYIGTPLCTVIAARVLKARSGLDQLPRLGYTLLHAWSVAAALRSPLYCRLGACRQVKVSTFGYWGGPQRLVVELAAERRAAGAAEAALPPGRPERMLAQSAALLRRAAAAFYLCGHLMMLAWYASPLVANAALAPDPDTNATLPRHLLFDAWFPFDPVPSPNYELALLYQSVTLYIAFITTAVIDVFYVSVMVYLGVELEILNEAVARSCRSPEEKGDDDDDCYLLVGCVRHHQALNRKPAPQLVIHMYRDVSCSLESSNYYDRSNGNLHLRAVCFQHASDLRVCIRTYNAEERLEHAGEVRHDPGELPVREPAVLLVRQQPDRAVAERILQPFCSSPPFEQQVKHSAICFMLRKTVECCSTDT